MIDDWDYDDELLDDDQAGQARYCITALGEALLETACDSPFRGFGPSGAR